MASPFFYFPIKKLVRLSDQSVLEFLSEFIMVVLGFKVPGPIPAR